MAAANAFFEKYDADKDGMLNRREVLKYAKGEFSFIIPNGVVDSIFKVLAGDSQGVKRELFQRLKVSVGVAREKVQDDKRRELRTEKEKKLAQMKEEFQERVVDAAKEVDEAEERIGKAENVQQPMSSTVKDMLSTEMLKLCEAADGAIKEAAESVAEARKTVASLPEGCDAELRPWVIGEEQKLQFKMSRFDARLQKLSTVSTKFRDDAKKRETAELIEIEKKAITMIKYHQRVKKMKNEDVFAAVDTSQDGKIDETEFVAFFKVCEKDPTKKKEARKVEATEDGSKEEEEEDAVDMLEELLEEDFSKLFTYLDEEEHGFISKDKFCNLIRTFMKVAKDTVLTSDITIKESKTMRRLDVGEVVEVLEGPMEEAAVKVLRARVRLTKDDLEGWVTVAGNQGTTFLEEGGNLFKVVTETILTDSFALDGSSAKESSRKPLTRKLKVGEVVEVREWAKKEEKSGLMRMKCRVLSDGGTGWVTTVGNQGTIFVEGV